VISEPETYTEDLLVCVNTTSYDPYRREAVYNDSSCIIEADEHPGISHTTCVCYEGFPSGLCSIHHLESRLMAKGGKAYYAVTPPASPELLKKMRDGAARSDHLPYEAREVLEGQGLI
jgi:hypothetical protein